MEWFVGDSKKEIVLTRSRPIYKKKESVDSDVHTRLNCPLASVSKRWGYVTCEADVLPNADPSKPCCYPFRRAVSS